MTDPAIVAVITVIAVVIALAGISSWFEYHR